MKKISRILAVLLILLMLATMSVSCKKNDTDDEEVAVNKTDTDKEDSTDSTGDDTDDGKKDDTDDKGADTEKDDGKDNNKDDGGKKDNATDKKDDTPNSEKEVVNRNEDGGYAESEDGTVVGTQQGLEVNDDYVIEGVVSNDNGFVPDEEQGLEKSERRATEASKYNFDQNPLINRDRQTNSKCLPTFEIDDTGFVRAGTKLPDLKGKTLFFFTADNFAAWSYRNAKGETVDEWSWFKELKSELGLNIKYEVSQHMKSVNSALQYMNAGKQLDIIYSNHVVFPASICISRSITELVNINNLGSSPGVCKNTMDICKWGNTLRLISPIGVVDVIWYNQTLTSELKLSDPHKMWEGGDWNWDTFKKFMLSAPKTTQDGRELTAFVQWPSNCSYIWPSTNGSPRIYIDANAKVPQLINNWDKAATLEAWEFITGVMNSINYDASAESTPGVQDAHIGLYEGTTLMSATMYTQVYRDTEYSKNIQINWVPYPKSTNKGGVDVCQYYGFGMMLPKKTAKPDNVDYALKFMELWATRFTETVFDNLNTFEYYNFNYKQRKQYFDFVTGNVVFALAMNDFSDVKMGDFFNCFRGDSAYNVKTEAEKVANIVNSYVKESIEFGQ